MGVNVLDSVHSQATDKKTILELKKVLSYKKTFWKKSNFGKKQIEAEAYFIDGRTGIFLTGLLPRVKKIYTGEINTDNLERFEPKFKPNLKGITFRDDQITLIEAAIKNQRGIIVSATGCLAGTTKIRLNRNKNGYEITIENLYKRFNCLDNSYHNYSNNDTFVRSFNGETIKLQKIDAVIKSGFKKVFELSLVSGEKIVATSDHKFLTDRGWVELQNLDIKIHKIMCDTLHATKLNKENPQRVKKQKDTFVGLLNYHPYAIEITDKRRETKSKRIEKHRFIFEANLNNLSFDNYKNILRCDEEKSKKLEFIDPKIFHIHHIDNNHSNNSIENLQKLTINEHKKIHPSYSNFSQGVPIFKEIKNIKNAGFTMTYDIQCPNHHNFVANNMVVHNSGKSILAMGIMSCYPNDNILFLCHSISILEQMRAELIKFGFECNFIGGKNGSKEIKDGITLAIDKSLANIDPDKYDTHFDLTIIDEAHHVTSKTSNYGKILQNMLSPIKIGLTATMPSGREKILSMEGLLGPMIGNVTIQDGIKKGIFVKPKITLVNVPFQDSVGKLFKYPDIYREAVVESKIRNTLIVKNAIRQIDNNMTCLIMVKDIKHGENIIEIVCEKFSEYADNFLFIQGSTDTDVREKIKDSFENKEIKVVIATAIWREGINIKSLNSLIFAMSGKSAIQVLQTIGRTTRISEGKTSVEIIDFVDKYKYLSQHFCERLSIYLDEKWI